MSSNLLISVSCASSRACCSAVSVSPLASSVAPDLRCPLNATTTQIPMSNTTPAETAQITLDRDCFGGASGSGMGEFRAAELSPGRRRSGIALSCPLCFRAL